MTAMRFADTNVLLYSISTAPAEAATAEDMNDGQDYGGVKVVNPFKP